MQTDKSRRTGSHAVDAANNNNDVRTREGRLTIKYDKTSGAEGMIMLPIADIVWTREGGHR